jgi:hypothetical protein
VRSIAAREELIVCRGERVKILSRVKREGAFICRILELVVTAAGLYSAGGPVSYHEIYVSYHENLCRCCDAFCLFAA